MANKDLKDRYFVIPTGLKEHLSGVNESYNEGDASIGGKRLKELVETGKASYSQMKRIKNFFDTYEGDVNEKQYLMNGGDRMRDWVNSALKIARESIYKVKKAKMEGGIENAFIEKHTKDTTKNPTKVRMAKIHKGDSKNIMRGDAVYETENRINYIIEYHKKM